MRKYLMVLCFFIGANAYAYTECNEKIERYFVGTTAVNQQTAHLWVNFVGGGSASVSSESMAYEGMLSSTVTALVAKNSVTVRYFADNVACKDMHHGDWVGIWVYGQ